MPFVLNPQVRIIVVPRHVGTVRIRQRRTRRLRDVKPAYDER
jgi:hypothetical protein